MSEANARRSRSENSLESKNFTFDTSSVAWSLLFAEEDYPLRDKESIAQRCLALLVVACKAEGLEAPVLQQMISNHDLQGVFTAQEQGFLDTPVADEESSSHFLWSYEAAWALLWALNYVDDIGEVNRYADAAHAVLCMRERSHEEFLNDAHLRAQGDILDYLDLLYRYDLTALQHQQQGQPAQGLDEGVLYERFYALRWVADAEQRSWTDLAEAL